MNAKQWRAAGYFVLFRDERDGFPVPAAIVINKVTGEARCSSIRCGAWMAFEFEDLVPVALTPSMRESLRHCYCDQGCGTCDFCAGRRSDWVEGGPWSKPLPWEVRHA